MDKIYLAAYKKFSDYELLKVVCDKITERVDKENTTFYVTTGESGDNTCTKYAKDNGFKIEDWFPDEKFAECKKECMRNGHWMEFYHNVLVPEKRKYISMADHVILVWDHDKDNRGIEKAIRMAGENNKTMSIVIPEINEVHVFKPENKNKTYIYTITNNGIIPSRIEDKR